MCLAAHTDARNHCWCKQVCSAPPSAYIRLRFACRIYCCASAEHSTLPGRILFGDISVPCSTHICVKPLLLQTSLHRTAIRVYSAALCLPHILLRLGRAAPLPDRIYLEIYGCLTAPADAASLCRCKQVCSAPPSAYIRLRFACRTYCCASAGHSTLPGHILFGDISVPCSTHRCEKPLLVQTCLQRAGFSHLSLRFYISKWGGKYFCSALGFCVYLHPYGKVYV